MLDYNQHWETGQQNCHMIKTGQRVLTAYAVHWVRGSICTKQDVLGITVQKSDVVGISDSGNSIGISIGC